MSSTPTSRRFRAPKVIVPAALAVVLAAYAGGTAFGLTTGSDVQTLAAGAAATAAIAANQASHDSTADHTWAETDVQAVTLTGSGATTTSSGVTVAGSTVTVTAAGTYRFAGSLTNGQIAVNTTGTGIVRLILNGVTVANSTSSAINVITADEVMIVAQAGSTNQLSDASTYTYPSGVTEPDAALFSAADTTITGTGSLTVTGNAYDGIASKDGLVIDSVNLTVTAKDDGIRGKDYVIVNSGTITTTATGGDAIKSTNDTDADRGYVWVASGTITATAAAGDAVSAETDVIVTGGTITAKAGGGSTVTPGTASTKGLKAGVLVVVSDGTTTIDASDDGINSDANVTVEGGTTTIASGDDGVHGEAIVTVSGGTLKVTKSYEGVEGLKIYVTGGNASAVSSDDAFNASDPTATNDMATSPNALISISGGTTVVAGGTDGLDSNGSMSISGGNVIVDSSTTHGGGDGALDANGTFTITGGTVYATAVTAVTGQTPSTGQGLVSVTFSANQAAGTIVHLATTAGVQIASYQSTTAFKMVLFSSSQITRGTTYAVYTGGSVSGTAVAGGLYTGGTLSGTQVSTVTAVGGTSSTVTTAPTTATTTAPATTAPATTAPATTAPATTAPATTASATTAPATTAAPAGAACKITDTVTAWSTGLTSSITIANTGSTAISSWTLAFTLPAGQTIVSGWSANYTGSSGAVTASNVSYNGAIPAGGSAAIGFQASQTGSAAIPAAFTLNGTACTTA
jgi:hypothetical protein